MIRFTNVVHIIVLNNLSDKLPKPVIKIKLDAFIPMINGLNIGIPG